MEWLKKNWLMVVCGLIALVSGTDTAVGMSQGKALLNVMNLPSLAGITGSLGFMLVKFLKTKGSPFVFPLPGPKPGNVLVTVSAISDDATRKIQAIFKVAEDADMTDDMIKNLAAMASATVIGHADRVKAARSVK